MSKLTVKQQRFVDFFDGNGTETARKAGYKGSDNTLAQVARENLRKPQILKAILDRENQRNNKDIATREERQNFWTDVLNDKEEKIGERLRASELLGKSEGDFLQRHEVDTNLDFGVIELPAEEDDD